MDVRAFKSPRAMLCYALGCAPFSLLCLQWDVTPEKGLRLAVALLCLIEGATCCCHLLREVCRVGG